MSISVDTIWSTNRKDNIHAGSRFQQDWLSYLELSCIADTSFVFLPEVASILHTVGQNSSTRISVRWNAQACPNQCNVWRVIKLSIYLYHLLLCCISGIHTMLKFPVHLLYWAHAHDRHLILVISHLWGSFILTLTDTLFSFFRLIAFAPPLPNTTTANSVVELISS